VSASIDVSVIIPTFNRKHCVRDTLISLASQTYPAARFEVIVVDDESTDGTYSLAEEKYPFKLSYVHQQNQGDAFARNRGAELSSAEILIFLDDDMVVHPEYLNFLVSAHQSQSKRIITGTEYLSLEECAPKPFIPDAAKPEDVRLSSEPQAIAFVEVCSNNMSIRRQDYNLVGGMQNLDFRGSSLWCDVEFSYRAFQLEFEFLRIAQAACYHRDYAARSLIKRISRMREAAYRAVPLFQKYPNLIGYLPMFSDKTPIRWGADPASLIIRKIRRQILSSSMPVTIMERFGIILERSNSESNLFRWLDRMIIGAQIYRGFREGRREIAAR